jgi:DNA polymerase-3 subunit gamma/tau
VLRLLGAVPSQLIEELFTAVKDRSREQVLHVVARLVEEGYQLPHFCSQLVRAVRNLLVVKLAGPDPHLLESSPEETERLAALAQDFSEEDVMRFLDILLALHQQLRYTMEPRFYMELGLLKLVEAERLIAIEELLAQSESLSPGPAVGKRNRVGTQPEARVIATAHAPATADARPAGLSPFERDTLRKRQDPAMPAADAVHAPVAQNAIPREQLPSREETWSQEIVRRLEARSKHGLVSLLAGARWEFGESEVRLRPASAGLAAIVTDADRQTLEAVIADVAGKKLRLTLAEDAAGATAPRRSGAATRNAAKPASAPDATAEARVREDPEVREFEQLFGKPVTGIRKRKD